MPAQVVPPPRIAAHTHPVSVAPMMDRTDRHFRVLMRSISRRTLLYTEMVVAQAIAHGDHEMLLGYDDVEHPIALQLGGDDPTLLAAAAVIAQDRGYDEVNLNIGCPSSRVQSGNFGVCLMADPERVADCVSAMRQAVSLPITVKHRIGFDDVDHYDHMLRFVQVVAATGCDRFSVHARKAWLKGLSPRENRNVPPLRYDDVYRLKRELPHLAIEINGGLTVADIATQLTHVDAAMLGRAAWDDPFSFATIDRDVYGSTEPLPTREQVLADYLVYAERRAALGDRTGHLVKPLLNLYSGEIGARVWRRHLTGTAARDPVREVLQRAVDAIVDTQTRYAASRGDTNDTSPRSPNGAR